MPFAMLRRWHRHWFIPIEVGLLLAVAAWWWLSYASPIGRLRAAGEPTAYEDLVAAPVPDAQNAAAALRDAGDRLAPHAEAVSQALDALEEEPPAIDKARATLEQTAGVRDTIAEAVGRPEYASLLTAEQMADSDARLRDAQRARSLARLLWLDCRVALADGRTDEAAAAATLARLGKLLEGEPTLTNRMIACAIQTMAIDAAERVAADGSLDDAARERLDAALAPLEDRSGLATMLRSERVVVLENIATMPLHVQLWERPGLLRLFEQLIAAAESGDQSVPQPQGLSALARTVGPAAQAAWGVESRVADQARAAREALAAGAGAQ